MRVDGGEHGVRARFLRAVCVDLDKTVREHTAATTFDAPPVPAGEYVFDSFRYAQYRYVITRSPDWRQAKRGVLSHRERTVARLAARGEALKVIADRCSISLQAVSTYLRRAKQKLRAASRADLVWAMMCEQAGPSAPLASFCMIGQLAVGGDWFRIFRGPATAERDIDSLLTTAEAEILESLLRGFRTHDIARNRGTTVATVATQISTIMRKAKVGSRAELVAAALAG